MKTGEPPGRSPDESPDSQPQVSPQGQKPVRIGISFKHEQPGAQHVHVLKRPFGDLMYDTTIERATNSNNETFRKTVGVLMGPTSVRVNGHVLYEATVSANPEKASDVLDRINAAMAELQGRYRVGFSDVQVRMQEQPENVTSNPGATLELSHEAPDRDGEPGQDDRDFSGAEGLRA